MALDWTQGRWLCTSYARNHINQQAIVFRKRRASCDHFDPTPMLWYIGAGAKQSQRLSSCLRFVLVKCWMLVRNFSEGYRTGDTDEQGQDAMYAILRCYADMLFLYQPVSILWLMIRHLAIFLVYTHGWEWVSNGCLYTLPPMSFGSWYLPWLGNKS